MNNKLLGTKLLQSEMRCCLNCTHAHRYRKGRLKILCRRTFKDKASHKVCEAFDWDEGMLEALQEQVNNTVARKNLKKKHGKCGDWREI